MNDWQAVVLAAGKGTRFKSRLPKPLHTLAGQEMIRYPLHALAEAGVDRIIVVVGHTSQQIRESLGTRYVFVEQAEQMGTGHALLQAQHEAEGKGNHILVLNADVPLVRPGTLQNLMERHSSTGAAITLLTARGSPSQGLGRIKRDSSGRITKIIEDNEAKGKDRDIQEVNGGIYCFSAPWLWESLPKLKPWATGEVYLTHLVALADRSGKRIEAVTVEDPQEVIGINTRVDLSRAEGVARQRIREQWMLAGVTIIDPPSTFIDALVEIGEDTVIEPNTSLKGKTQIGRDCCIGPHTIIADSTIGDRCRVTASVIEESALEEAVEVGPFSHIRPESHLESNVHVGNFGEIKKSRLGSGTQMGHFSYIGDAVVGKNVNIGAGTITCNFDGVRKNETIIEDDAFIGSDTMLVAPVRIGARAITGAGAVVTRDVPPDALVVGIPAKPRAKKRSSQPLGE